MKEVFSQSIKFTYLANVSVYMVGDTVYKPFPGCIENPIQGCVHIARIIKTKPEFVWRIPFKIIHRINHIIQDFPAKFASFSFEFIFFAFKFDDFSALPYIRCSNSLFWFSNLWLFHSNQHIFHSDSLKQCYIHYFVIQFSTLRFGDFVDCAFRSFKFILSIQFNIWSIQIPKSYNFASIALFSYISYLFCNTRTNQ